MNNIELPYQAEENIAENFSYRAFTALYQRIKKGIGKNKTIALCTDDALYQIATILAASAQNAEILLPSNNLPDTQNWLTKSQSLIIDDTWINTLAPSEENAPPILKNTTLHLRTSGSTGNAKTIQRTTHQLYTEAQHIAQALKPYLKQDLKTLHLTSSVNSKHQYGLSWRLFLSISQGMLLERHAHHFPENLLQSAKNPSILITTPTLLKNIPPQHPLLQTQKIQLIISAGSPLSQELREKTQKHLPCPLLDCYGSTETAVIALSDDGISFKPLKNVQIHKENEHTTIKSPWCPNPQQISDLIEPLADGKFKLHGRSDRIIKLADKRISLINIEKTLQQHPEVDDCHIDKHPTKERLCAWIVLKNPENTQTLKTLIKHLRKHHEPIAIPRYIRLCTQLPRNSQGKIIKQALTL